MNLTHVNSFLKEFDIFPYQYRIFMRTQFFVHKMCNNNSPVELKDCFTLKDKPDSSYYLRSNNKLLIIAKMAYSSFVDLTFKNLVAQIVNKLTCLNL